MAQMQTAKPIRKLTVAGAAGSVGAIFCWIYQLATKTEVPGPIAVAITTLLSAVASYIVPPSAQDQVIP